jgi:hypothetical protein
VSLRESSNNHPEDASRPPHPIYETDFSRRLRIVIAQHLLLLSRYVTVRIQDGGVEVVEEEQRLEMSLEI